MTEVKHTIIDEIGLIEISNPPVNAISASVRKGLLNSINELGSNSLIKAIVIAAPGRTFLAGADIKEFGKLTQGHSNYPVVLPLRKLTPYIDYFSNLFICTYTWTLEKVGVVTLTV